MDHHSFLDVKYQPAAVDKSLYPAADMVCKSAVDFIHSTNVEIAYLVD